MKARKFVLDQSDKGRYLLCRRGRSGCLRIDCFLLLVIIASAVYLFPFINFYFRSETVKNWKSLTDSERSRGSLEAIAEHVGMLN